MRARSLIPVVLLLAAAPAVPAQKLQLPPVTRQSLDNGIRLVLMEYRRAPTLSVAVLFRGGSAWDPPGREGLADLTADLLRRGTESRSAVQISEAIDFLGGSLGGGAGDDAVTVSLSVLSKDARAGLDLLADVIRRPTFPAEELERQRQLSIADLRSMVQNPSAVASYVAAREAYRDHPYGRAATITSLSAITREDVLGFYRSYLAPARMVVVAVGDFKTAEMAGLLRERFGDWTGADSPPPDVPPVKPAPPHVVLVDKPDATQTQARFLGPGFPRKSRDFVPAQLAEAILGGGFTSRLVDEIRVNRGLTYSIGASFEANRQGGSLRIGTFTKVESTRALIDAVRGVLRRTARQGVTPAELKKMRGYLAGQYAIASQTPGALAARLMEVELYGLPADFPQTYLGRLAAATLADVNRVARACFAPEKLSLVLVGPAAKLEAQLKGIPLAERLSAESVGR